MRCNYAISMFTYDQVLNQNCLYSDESLKLLFIAVVSLASMVRYHTISTELSEAAPKQ